jgi:hypothetical protein
MDNSGQQQHESSERRGHSLGGGGDDDNGVPLTPDELRRRRVAALERFSAKSADKKQNILSETNKQMSSPPSKPKPTTTPDASSSSSASSIPPTISTPMDTYTPPPSTSPYEYTSNSNASILTTDTSNDRPMTLNDDDEDAALQAALAMSLAENASASVASTEKEFDSDDDDEQLAASLRLSLESTAAPTTSTPASSASSAEKPMMSNDDQWCSQVKHIVDTTRQPCNILDFHCIMWDASITTENDQQRWLAQGIQFKVDDSPVPEDSLLATIISNHSWGLTQAHGGPCGVLAAIQAEFLRLLLFGPRRIDANASQLYSIDFPSNLSNEIVCDKPDLSPTLLRQGLALALGMILARASLKASATLHDDQAELEQQQQQSTEYYGKDPKTCIAVPKKSMGNDLEWNHLEPWSSDIGMGLSEHLVTYQISLPDQQGSTKRPKLSNNASALATMEENTMMELARHTARFLLETNLLEWFQRPGGVLLFVTSLALSRGIPNVQGDMDDFTAKLTSNFGHCSQELINLLLTGQAVSNVFDHTLRPSGELICRGIQSRPDIGYLSALEAMRYLEVGGFYKTPRFPIWVVGSTSHFTVMFGDAACLQESPSDVLLEKVRRAFKRMDGGAEENGFIQSHQLGQFLKSLDFHLPDHSVHTLAAAMEVHGAGIILWEDLWKRTSRLLTGASLEAVLTNASDHAHREPATSSSNVEQLSDEELARRLQAEWNGEPVVLPPAPSPPPPSNNNRMEQYGTTFQLYHYNGLRGGKLRCFRVTRLSADEAIGASVALGSGQSSGPMMADSCDLEDVLRCKWPSCKINWMSGQPPSID